MKTPIIFLFFTLFLAGCEPISFMGASTFVGGSMVEERSVKEAWSDTKIKTKLNLLLMDQAPKVSDHVEVNVREGRVLLTGTVTSPKDQIEAVRLAWQVKGVKEVRDETTLGENIGFGQYAKDSWITMQAKTKLLWDGDIVSVNYSINSINGNVYLMGIAQNEEELTRAIHAIKTISGVKKIFSYVRFKDQSDPIASSTDPNYGNAIDSPPTEIHVRSLKDPSGRGLTD